MEPVWRVVLVLGGLTSLSVLAFLASLAAPRLRRSRPPATRRGV
ncbi:MULTISPECIES: hypothetical protein [unclassified Streptomyces]|jgi:hypothetical protein